MRKIFCDACGHEIVVENSIPPHFELSIHKAGGGKMSIINDVEVFKPVGKITREDICLHCYLKAVNGLDKRPTEATAPAHHLELCVDAMRWFVSRVDKGEVLSRETYNRFKGILNSIGMLEE